MIVQDDRFAETVFVTICGFASDPTEAPGTFVFSRPSENVDV